MKIHGKYLIRFQFIVIAILVGSTTIIAQNCPPEINDEIQQCVVPIAQFAEALGVDMKESNLGSDHRLMPSMGSEMFRQLCGKISTFNNCVRNAKRHCPNHITLTIINASYGYLCNDGYNVFLKNADCLMNLDQEDSVRLCHERTMAVIKNSTTDTKSTMNQKLVRMCDSLNYFATCVEQPVLKECGTSAWNVIARVLHDTTKTLMPSCRFAVPISDDRTSPSDTALREKSSQRLNNGSKTAGRQKQSRIGTMTTNSGTDGKNNNVDFKNAERSLSLSTDHTNKAPSAAISLQTCILIVAVGLLNFCLW